MVEFTGFISESNLMDFPLMGGVYKWSNHRTWYRLDGFLVTSEWKSHFSNVCDKSLTRLGSRYCTLRVRLLKDSVNT